MNVLKVFSNIVPVGSPVAKKLKTELEAEKEELHFGTLVPFKNHEDGLQAFSHNVSTCTSDPTSKHFAEALEAVIADKMLDPHQTDPLEIIQAWKKYDEVRPVIFTKKAMLSTAEIALKDAVDKRFITYMQVCLCCGT